MVVEYPGQSYSYLCHLQLMKSYQAELERNNPGATIIPVIISSDKTQLTLFRNKSAYPIYLTIGNLPKEIRRRPSHRAQILLGYLPATRLEGITNKAARRRALANLYHACVARILQPLEEAGVDGIMMSSADGVVRRCHPILAAFIGDYPEQLLVTCCKNGECPQCEVLNGQLGDCGPFPPRNLDQIQAALYAVKDGTADANKLCADARIRPVYMPFWQNLPYVNIFQCIPPDVLHEIFQGTFKHLVSWLRSAFSDIEIDARCRRLPPNHNVHTFKKGISILSRVSGKEHKHMCRIILGLVIGIPLPNNLSSARLIQAVRAMLDFIYLSQYPAHTSTTLSQMQDALGCFHENKSIFIELGIRTNFNIPKLHKSSHYSRGIEIIGTTDNSNTESTERLHIDLAKDAYRASNRKDEYPQMTRWLERREKVLDHSNFVNWRLAGSPAADPHLPPRTIQTVCVIMTRHPSVKAVKWAILQTSYGAFNIEKALADFIVLWTRPALTRVQAQHASGAISFTFRGLRVWHKMKFVCQDPQDYGLDPSIRDAAHVRPSRTSKKGKEVPARFDTVLIGDGTGDDVGLHGKLNMHPNLCSRLIFEQVGVLHKYDWSSKSPRMLWKRCSPIQTFLSILPMFTGSHPSQPFQMQIVGYTRSPTVFEMVNVRQV